MLAVAARRDVLRPRAVAAYVSDVSETTNGMTLSMPVLPTFPMQRGRFAAGVA
jgi:hypothetical protein